MKIKAQRTRRSRVLTAAGWITGILSLVPLFYMFALLFLVPNDPSQSVRENVSFKDKMEGCCFLALVIFVAISRWSFARRD